ncbi:hypothetical protein [uncultured Paludibaculum sp.]|uniref:hypothetical protein n=1 Tax=uncultured Paludibaculum sp. TaxID=1765020 RepID=UPI002AAB2726|nr:hypothetical protein [uncultured Paludibaculum sp.]
MAGLAALIAALARSAQRSFGRFGSVTHNNLFAVILLMMAEEPMDRPSSTAVFYLLIGALAALPLAGDMARRIPEARMALWPLTAWQRAVVFAFNLLLNPMLPLAVLFALLSRHPAVGTGLFALGILAPVVLGAFRTWKNPPRLLRLVPSFPGRLGGLIQNRVRELLQTLDVWFAALLSLGGFLYRIFYPHPDPMASVVIGGLIVILLSTAGQASSGFDAESAVARRLLLPLSGRDVLLARDLAWFVPLLFLTAPYGWHRTAAAGFVALIAGHRTILAPPTEQTRWQFAAGQLIPTGLFQIFAVILATSTAHQFGPVVTLISGGVWWASLEWFGRKA